QEVTSAQPAVVQVAAGPERHAEKERITADLLAKRVSPGEARGLPLTPGRVSGRPPGDRGTPLVEGRRGERGGDGRARRRRGLRLRRLLPGSFDRRSHGRRLLCGDDSGRGGEPSAGNGVHELPAEDAGDGAIELRPALIGERVPLDREDHEILEGNELFEHIL